MNLGRLAGIALIATVVTANVASAQTAEVPRYEVDASWPQALPDRWITGQLGGVCTDTANNIYVVNRGDLSDEEQETSESAPPFLKFDQSGKVVLAWGDLAQVPAGIHGCATDRDGNVYAAGNRDGVVQKYSPLGELLLQIGKRGVFDSSDGTVTGVGLNAATDRLFLPSDVAVDPVSGDIFVSDGYGNRRVAVFDRTGRFLRQWGRQGTLEEIRAGIGSVFAQVVHCIAVSVKGLIYVCDRQGNRIQVFTAKGGFVRNIWVLPADTKTPSTRGTVWSIAFSPDAEQKMLIVMDGGHEQVHVIDHESGKLLGSFGRPGHQAGNFTHGHNLAVDSFGNIYVAETGWGRRVQKFRVQRPPNP